MKPPFECIRCGEVLERESDALKHARTVHDVTGFNSEQAMRHYYG